MVARWLFGVGLLGVLGADPSTEGPKPDLAEYEAVKATVGRDADAQVKLALWCESHGLTAERARHLALAVLTDPKNATARGLMGLVEYGGKWRRPDAVAEKVKADEALTARLAEYNGRRARMAETADAHHKLALWCEQNGLKAEAVAHLTTVTRLDPGNESAWKRLGYKRHGHRWVTDAQLAAEKADAEAQKKADHTWKPLLTKWKGWLNEGRRHDEAETALGALSDPRAVPSVWAVFAVDNDPASQVRAVELFGRIDAPAASRALALLSIYSRSAEVRRVAAETLLRRDRREFLDVLIAALRDPVKFEVKRVGGPGSPGALFVAGKRFNVQRLYTPPSAFSGPIPPNATLVYDQNGLPVLTGFAGYSKVRETGAMLAAETGTTPKSSLEANSVYIVTREQDYRIPIGQMMIEAQRGAAVAQQQLQNDVAAVEAYNNDAHDANSLIITVLKGVTGQDLGENQESWSRWWTNEQGYALASNSYTIPTITQNVPIGFTPQASPQLLGGPIVGAQRSHSCFAAGTPVRTLTGLRPIESIRAGDRVLTQDGLTGLLTYQPVVAVFHNPPNQTLRVTLGGESVVATGIHRFWKSGHGWVMARDLKPGDLLRTLDGARTVESVEDDQVQPVFNLQVADGGSFLVGGPGLLVHDNSLVNPVTHPFDAEPTLAALAPAGR